MLTRLSNIKVNQSKLKEVKELFESENEIMSVNEVAEVLHVGLNTVYR